MSINNPLELSNITTSFTKSDKTSPFKGEYNGSNFAGDVEENTSQAKNDNVKFPNSSVDGRSDELNKNDAENIRQEGMFLQNAIVDKLNIVSEQLSMKSTSLIFEFDDANEPPIVKVIDKESGDVIREIPPKELREIAQALTDIADNLINTGLKKTTNQTAGIFINERS